MSAVKEPNLGRFSIEIELANDEDLVRAKSGDIACRPSPEDNGTRGRG